MHYDEGVEVDADGFVTSIGGQLIGKLVIPRSCPGYAKKFTDNYVRL